MSPFLAFTIFVCKYMKAINFTLCIQVFYKFLEYYSTFDWGSYCITINGPVSLSSLAEVTGMQCLIVSKMPFCMSLSINDTLKF